MLVLPVRKILRAKNTIAATRKQTNPMISVVYALYRAPMKKTKAAIFKGFLNLNNVFIQILLSPNAHATNSGNMSVRLMT